MKTVALFNITQNQTISNHIEVAESFAERAKGLLGRKGLDGNQGLWIHECKSIHTFFMRFTIDVLYVDKNLKVTCVHRNIKPWRLSWGKFKSDSCFEFQSPALTQNVNIGDFLRVSA